MKKTGFLVWLVGLAFCHAATADSGPISEEFNIVIKHRSKEVWKLARSENLVDAVKLQNSQALSAGEIEKRDVFWQGEASDAERQAMLSEAAVKLLSGFLAKRGVVFSELILTDKRGANVAAFPLSSDYWQGDEEKFVQAFTSAEIYYGPIEHDDSTDLYATQVAVPVLDGRETIGVLIAGIRMSYIETRSQGY
jgi:hypothetical protein